MSAPACSVCGAVASLGARFCRTCGQPLAETPAAVDGVPPTGRAARPRPGWRTVAWWRARWGRVVAIAAVVTVLTVAAVVWFGQEVVNPPDKVVRAWFAALANRDTAAAAELRSVALLRGDFLADPGYTPPAGLEVGEITFGGPLEQQRPNKAVAYVKVAYLLGEQRVEQTVEVTRDRTGAVREWSLSEGATGQLDIVAGPMQRARVGGELVATLREPRPAGTSDTSGALTLPPGIYTVAATDQDALFTAASKTIVVPAGRGRPASVTLDLTIKPEAAASINEQVKSRLDDCAKRTDPYPYDCPFQRTGSYLGTIDSAKWTIAKYPVIELTPVAEPYDGGPLAELSTKTTGVARLAVAAYATGGKVRTEEFEFKVSGEIRLREGKLTWTGGKSGIRW